MKALFPVLSIDIRLFAFIKTSKKRKMVYVTAEADYSNETYRRYIWVKLQSKLLKATTSEIKKSGRFVRHLVYHRVEESWYRELSQICYALADCAPKSGILCY